MHAKHADNSKPNEPSGRVIGCAFTVLNTLVAGHMKSVPPAYQLYNSTVRRCTIRTS
jgi:hypothetical protein